MYLDKCVDFRHRDERGELVQLIHSGYEQVNLLKSRKGTLRGGHFHKVRREVFYLVSGSVDVTMWDGRERIRRRFSEGSFFEICPWTVHSMCFPEDCVMIALYDRAIEQADGTKDIFPEEEFV